MTTLHGLGVVIVVVLYVFHVLGFDPELELLPVWSFSCSSHEFTGFLWVLHFPSHPCRWTSDS